MKRRTAALVFLGICIVLAILLLTRTIPPLVSGITFAIALVAYGLVARKV
ncbi:MAG: hypothetical protein ABIH70_04530 [Chloroflexota bacterium]